MEENKKHFTEKLDAKSPNVIIDINAALTDSVTKTNAFNKYFSTVAGTRYPVHY